MYPTKEFFIDHVTKVLDDISSGKVIFKCELVKSYYSESYAKIILPNEELTLHIDNENIFMDLPQIMTLRSLIIFSLKVRM